MHELGIVIDIVKQIEEYKTDNKIDKIKAVVLQVGELSGVVPKYIKDVYPLAIELSSVSDMELIIEETPGIGKCKKCGLAFNLVHNDNKCPLCDHDEWEIITGTELMIKELHTI